MKFRIRRRSFSVNGELVEVYCRPRFKRAVLEAPQSKFTQAYAIIRLINQERSFLL
jgi:hypothetical protein